MDFIEVLHDFYKGKNKQFYESFMKYYVLTGIAFFACLSLEEKETNYSIFLA